MTLQHVQRGQPLRIGASDWNAMVDAARAYHEGQLSQDGGPASSAPGCQQTSIVLVRNNSGADRDRFAVLGIDTPIIAPSGGEGNLDEFKRQVALKVVAPTKDHVGKFVVLDQPLKSGAIGRAYIDGVCPVQIDIANAGHRFADVTPAPGGFNLKSGPTGTAQILWADTGTGLKWAVVRLGATATFPAKLTSESSGIYQWKKQRELPGGGYEDDPANITGGNAREANGATGIATNTIVFLTYAGFDNSNNPRYQFSHGGLPGGGVKYQVLSVLNDTGAKGWDWVRAHT